MFPPEKKTRFLSLMGILSGVFWSSKWNKFLTKVSLCVFNKVSLGFIRTMRLCLKEKNIFQHIRFSDVFNSEKAIFKSQG